MSCSCSKWYVGCQGVRRHAGSWNQVRLWASMGNQRILSWVSAIVLHLSNHAVLQESLCIVEYLVVLSRCSDVWLAAWRYKWAGQGALRLQFTDMNAQPRAVRFWRTKVSQDIRDPAVVHLVTYNDRFHAATHGPYTCVCHAKIISRNMMPQPSRGSGSCAIHRDVNFWHQNILNCGNYV